MGLEEYIGGRSGQHLIEDDTQGILVQPAAQPATFPLFGGHVMRRSQVWVPEPPRT